MPVLTIGCSHGNHNDCTSKICECTCHRGPLAALEEARARRARARDLVIVALRDFNQNPDLFNTQTAMLALTEYEKTLKEARRGR